MARLMHSLRRRCTDMLVRLVGYLMLDLFYSGGTCFSFFEYIYIKFFKKSKKSILNQPKDWENPLVTSRNRRYAHCQLYGFRSSSQCLEYWRNGGGSHPLTNTPLLTYLLTYSFILQEVMTRLIISIC